MAKKRKTAKSINEEVGDVGKGGSAGLEAAPAMYTVAQCQWCGMKWKHFGEDSPAHFCGKVCASHQPVEDSGQ